MLLMLIIIALPYNATKKKNIIPMIDMHKRMYEIISVILKIFSSIVINAFSVLVSCLRCKGTTIVWNIQQKHTLFFKNMQEKRKYFIINKIR
jgi:hypothetical protein